MKIAVLASGLKRNYQYTVKYLQKNLIKDMDIFVLLDISIEKSTPGKECPFYHGETRTDEEYLVQLFGDRLKVLEFINSETNLQYKQAIQNYIKKVKDNIKGADLTGKLRYHLDYGEDRIAEYPLKQFYNQP